MWNYCAFFKSPFLFVSLNIRNFIGNKSVTAPYTMQRQKVRSTRGGVAGNSIEEERSDGRESDVNKGNEPMRIAS